MRVIFDCFRRFIPGNDGFVKVYASFICLVFCSNKRFLFEYDPLNTNTSYGQSIVRINGVWQYEQFKCILRYLITTAVILQGFKIMQILCSDWLPERARWAYLCRSGPPALVPGRKNFCFRRYNKPFTDHACTWLDQPRHFFRVSSWFIEKRSTATLFTLFARLF